MEHIDLKQEVIAKYINNPYLDLDKLSIKLGITASWANKIIEEYKSNLTHKQELYLVDSQDLANTYYLFTEAGEKTVEISSGMIRNIKNFTEYERTWLRINKNWI